MAGFLKNRRPFLSGYYLVDNLKGNYEIPSFNWIFAITDENMYVRCHRRDIIDP